MPHGVRIIHKLQALLRKEYKRFGYQEVRTCTHTASSVHHNLMLGGVLSQIMTPLVFDKSLWEQSGHWQHYAEDMFIVSVSRGCIERMMHGENVVVLIPSGRG